VLDGSRGKVAGVWQGLACGGVATSAWKARALDRRLFK
jgi:hypothetical protein